MKMLSKYLTIFIFTALVISSCNEESDEPSSSTPSSQNSAPTCTDGIQNQDETGVDCGGICPPCAIDTLGKDTSAFFVVIDGNVAKIDDFSANRNPSFTQPILALIATTENNERISIILEEPTSGWKDSISYDPVNFGSNLIDYQFYDTNSSTDLYLNSSTAGGNGKAFISEIDYRNGGTIRGTFSGTVEDTSRNQRVLTHGVFNGTFIN